MRDVYAYIDAHQDEFIADLQALVRQPSISAQNVGLRECAELVRDMMHRDGLDA
jgi:acetylornithine deacetylase/succinyl-diaminopimelate desuccinylase-like protein